LSPLVGYTSTVLQSQLKVVIFVFFKVKNYL
jgi:hypothetical protein